MKEGRESQSVERISNGMSIQGRILPRLLPVSCLFVACVGPAAQPPVDLSLTIRLLEAQPTRISVTIGIDGSYESATRFRLEEGWAGVFNAGGALSEVRAVTEAGLPLRAFQSSGQEWTVLHEPGARIFLSYDLLGDSRPPSDDPSEYTRVLVQDQYFQMIGHVGLLQPEHLDKNRVCRLRMDWKGFQESGWTAVSSFSADQDGFELEVPFGRLVHSLFFAGKLRLYPRFIQGNQVQFALSGEWGFLDHEFLELSEKIIQVGRDFFQDHSQPYFLVTLVPVIGESSANLGGTGLTQSFALFISPNHRLSGEGEEALRVKSLLAHELFHNWNGGKILREVPEESIYWFSEGFTDYYARRLLRRAGLLTDREYVDSLNQLFERYCLNPLRNAPNETIIGDFWNDPVVKELPYRRGDILALVLDREIRRRSAGSLGLDDLMRELFERSEDRGRPSSMDELMTLFGRYTSKSFVEELRRVIELGGMPGLPADLVEPQALLAYRLMGPFDLGFDFEESRRIRSLQGVRRDSAAYLAGARDGQRLVGWNLKMGDVNHPVELTILDQQGRRRISYLPQSLAKVSVPQYSLR